MGTIYKAFTEAFVEFRFLGGITEGRKISCRTRRAADLNVNLPNDVRCQSCHCFHIINRVLALKLLLDQNLLSFFERTLLVCCNTERNTERNVDFLYP